MVRRYTDAMQASQNAMAQALGLDPSVVVWVDITYDGVGYGGLPPHYAQVRSLQPLGLPSVVRETRTVGEDVVTSVIAVTRDRALELLEIGNRAYQAKIDEARRDVASLSRADIGRTVTITHDGTTVSGPLRAVEVWTDRVPVQSLGEREPEHVDGPVSVTLTIGAWRTGSIPPDTKVDVR